MTFVATTTADARFSLEKFERPPSVLRIMILRTKSMNFARNRMPQSEIIASRPAKNTPSAETLRVRPDLPAQKQSWLQRHDCQSGDLCGILPLII